MNLRTAFSTQLVPRQPEIYRETLTPKKKRGERRRKGKEGGRKEGNQNLEPISKNQ